MSQLRRARRRERNAMLYVRSAERFCATHTEQSACRRARPRDSAICASNPQPTVHLHNRLHHRKRLRLHSDGAGRSGSEPGSAYQVRRKSQLSNRRPARVVAIRHAYFLARRHRAYFDEHVRPLGHRPVCGATVWLCKVCGLLGRDGCGGRGRKLFERAAGHSQRRSNRALSLQIAGRSLRRCFGRALWFDRRAIRLRNKISS